MKYLALLLSLALSAQAVTVTGLSFTLLDQSGLEAKAANRIITDTGGLLNSTNRTAFATLLYDDAASRWRVISFR